MNNRIASVAVAAFLLLGVSGCELPDWIQIQPPDCPACECTLQDCIDAFPDWLDF